MSTELAYVAASRVYLEAWKTDLEARGLATQLGAL